MPLSQSETDRSPGLDANACEQHTSLNFLLDLIQKMQTEGLITSDFTAEEWSSVNQACRVASRDPIKRG